jgi:hypothetical protein
MSDIKRTRHTASFRLSHFLNSKDSLQQTWLTATLVSILRYIHDVMDMNYVTTGQEIFNKSHSQTALYARTSKASVKRAMRILLKHNLLTLAHAEPRKVAIYGIGKLIETRVTLTPDDSTRVTVTPELGSPRPQGWGHSDPLVTSSCKKGKKERERSPLFFEPDDSSIVLAHELRLKLADELESFRNRHKGEKTQYEFQRWMKRSKEYQGRNAGVTETRSTIQEWGPGHPSYDALHGVKSQGVNGNGLQMAGNNSGGNGRRQD